MSKSDVLQVVPPSAVLATTVAGLTLQDWASIAAIALIAMQGAYLLWKWRREAKKRA